MPTSLFSDMDRSNSGGTAVIEDRRALQLAFELSMLDFDNNQNCPGTGTGTSTSAANGVTNEPDPLQTAPTNVFEEARSKKSQNMTECVPVPSSEHVAEIVGRQGECENLYLLLICPRARARLLSRSSTSAVMHLARAHALAYRPRAFLSRRGLISTRYR